MFTAYAISLRTGIDTEIGCGPPTLDEALTHLRELVIAEMEVPHGPHYDRYGLSFTSDEGKGERDVVRLGRR